jgi:PhnB protein
MSELYPFLAVRDVDAAVAFYGRAFGATEQRERVRAPDGPQVAVLSIAGHSVGVAISLHVDDPDAVAAAAIAAGASEMFPVADQPYGLRQGRVVDPFGHHWLIGRPL